MSDALVRHAADEATRMRCHCLAHGRRQCRELADVFPAACQVVLDALRQVCDHEDMAEEQQLSARERFAYHQVYSGPRMAGLKWWLAKQFDERLGAPHSSLGKARAYLRGPWDTLTPFFSVPGARLDTNLVERALQRFLRQRQNSLFYATESSASIASVLTSLMATCLYAGVHTLEYLVALQEHRTAVFADPVAWLPWTYQGRLAPPEASLRPSSAIPA
jgi:hypothetical protein